MKRVLSVFVLSAVLLRCGWPSPAEAVESRIVVWGANSYGEGNVPEGLNDAIAISAGYYQGLAVRANGTVVVWGWYYNGLNWLPYPSPPAGLSNVVAVSAGGYYHSLALRADGTVVAWGPFNGSGALNVPKGLTNVIAICSRSSHSLALRADGTVVAWGEGFERSVPRDLTNAIAIATGDAHCLALKADGTVVSWGTLSNVPPQLTDVVAIAAAGATSAAVQADGSVLCWDANSTYVPAGVSNVVSIEGGSYHYVAREADGTVAAWTVPFGIGPQDIVEVPAGLRNVVAVSASVENSMALVKLPVPLLPAISGIGLNPGTEVSTNAAAGGFYGYDEAALDLLRTNGMYGWTFYLKKPVTLTGFGWYDAGSDGLAQPHQIGLWQDASGQTAPPYITPSNATLVTSITLPQGTNAPLSGPWRRVDFLTTITLPPGGYALAGDYSPDHPETVKLVRNDVEGFAALPLDARMELGEPSQSTGAFGCPNTFLPVSGADLGPMLFVEPENTSTNNHIPGTFTNLDFEMADIPNPVDPFAALSITNALPYWTADADGLPSGLVVYDGGPLDGSAVGLYYQSALFGNYSAFLQDDYTVGTGADLEQTGLIPSDARSIRFFTTSLPFQRGSDPDAGPQGYGLSLLVNGQAIDYSPIEESTNWILWSADVSPFAATASEVRFWLRTPYPTNPPAPWDVVTIVTLDNISFTLEATVPLIREGPHRHSTFKGALVRFNVTTRGEGPFSYQWQFNGTDLPGATGRSLVLTNVQPEQAGNYAVVASNALGSARSQAPLTINSIALWGSDLSGGDWRNAMPEGLSNVVAITAGDAYSMALQSDGAVVLWGFNRPTPPFWLSNVVGIAAGPDHCLALRADGRVITWGWGLHTGSDGAAFVAGLHDAVAVAAGTRSSLALTSSGALMVWTNLYIGSGLTTYKTGDFVAIAASGNHRLALRSDGTVLAWGSNSYGESTPPPDLTNAVGIACGPSDSLALRADGTVVGWGDDRFGQTDAPPGLSNVVSIAAGFYHSLALKADGTVVGWGAVGITNGAPPFVTDQFGQAVPPTGLSDVLAIAAAGDHSLALIGDAPPLLRVPLLNPSRGTNGFTVSIPTQSGRVYRLEYKDSLAQPAWTPLPLVAGTGRDVTLTDPSATAQQRFYRARRW